MLTFYLEMYFLFYPDQGLTKTRAVFILRFVIVKPPISYPFEPSPFYKIYAVLKT